jgi:hypothetical protein
MSSVIRKTPNPDTLQYTYLHSVNSPDYDPTYWIHNPDVQNLINNQIPTRYWKVEQYYGDSTAEILYRVVEMDIEEKTAVEDMVPKAPPQPVSLSEEFRDAGGRLRVHQTSRNEGLAIHWTSVGDDRNTPTKFGNGSHLSHRHHVGDSTSEIVYIDFNGLLNESWIHEVVLTWADCDLDTIIVDIVPDVCSIMDSTAGNFTKYEAILLPAVPGTGNCNIISDVYAYRGGLVARDNPSDPTQEASPAFWNANFNEETERFENLTPAPNGDGAYNIFHEERILNRTFNEIQLLKNGFQIFNSSDTDQLTHGLRLRVEFKTNLPDHEWTVSGILVMHRKLVSIKSDGCF